MALKFANNAVSTLASSITSSQATITLQAGTGSRFPPVAAGDYFMATIVSPAANREIVKVTAKSGDSLTVFRGQEGTTAIEFPAGSYIANQLTAGSLAAFYTADNDGAGSGLDADLLRALAPASGNTPNTVVTRDASGNTAFNQVTANQLNGPLVGNVTGNVNGNVTGNVTGNLSGNILGRRQADAIDMKLVALGSGSGTRALDQATANYFSATVAGATTFQFTNPPPAGYVGSFMLELTNGGSAVVTWPTSVKWPGGTAPTLTAAGIDLLTFVSDDQGTTWRGNAVQVDSK